MSNLAKNVAKDVATNLATDLADGGGGGGLVPDAFTVGQWDLNGTSTVGALEVDVNTLPADNGDAITAVQYRVNDGVATAFSPALATTGIREITGLNADSFDEHDIEIRAVNGVGPGPWSDVKSKNPPIAGLLALSPTALYAASADYLTVDGSTNVEVWADAVSPLDSSKWMEQTTAGSRPAFVTPSSMPSGISAVQGDAVDDILTNTTHTGLFEALNSADFTHYILLDGVDTAGSAIWVTVGNVSRSEIGGNTAVNVRARFPGGSATLSDSGPMWAKSTYDGSNGTIETDNVAEVSAAGSGTNAETVASICARTSGNPAMSPIVAWIVFDRVLTGTEQAEIESILDAMGGI